MINLVIIMQSNPYDIYLKIKSLMFYHNIAVKYFFYLDVLDEKM